MGSPGQYRHPLNCDRTTGTWIKRATRNSASLFRHVLQHPGNARRVPDSQINLTALADWHESSCRKGSAFDFRADRASEP